MVAEGWRHCWVDGIAGFYEWKNSGVAMDDSTTLNKDAE